MTNKITSEVELQAAEPSVDIRFPLLAQVSEGAYVGMVVLFTGPNSGTVIRSPGYEVRPMGFVSSTFTDPRVATSSWKILPFGARVILTQAKV